MKFKRRPIVRDTVDALKGLTDYTVQREDGSIAPMSIEDFERDYEAVKRSTYVKKPRKPKVRKGVVQE